MTTHGVLLEQQTRVHPSPSPAEHRPCSSSRSRSCFSWSGEGRSPSYPTAGALNLKWNFYGPFEQSEPSRKVEHNLKACSLIEAVPLLGQFKSEPFYTTKGLFLTRFNSNRFFLSTIILSPISHNASYPTRILSIY